MKSLPSYITPSYIGALRTHQSHKHPTGEASSLRPHLHAMCLAEAARSTPATSSLFVELFGLIHLAAFLFTTALQVSEPASTVEVS